MASRRISRRALADFVAQRLAQNDSKIISQLAAFLVAENRIKEADLIVRQIEQALLAQQILLAEVTSVHPLSAELNQQIEHFLKQQFNAKKVLMTNQIAPDMLGGIKINTPDAELDGSLRRRLNNLKTSKI